MKKMMKTMKHNIFILLLACFSFMQATAQDMTTIHMKDGSSMSFENGRHNVTNIRLWRNTGEMTISSVYNNYIQMENVDGDYCALLSFDKGYTSPTDNSTLTICVGTTDNLTLESCDFEVPATDLEIGEKLYFQLGAAEMLNKSSWFKMYRPLPVVDYPLQKGQTYYWRPVMRVPYLQGGQSKEAIVYDKQAYSFRIPLLMTESGLLPLEQCGKDVVYPDTAAWSAFYKQYFPDVATDKFTSLGKLWTLWIADHQSEVTISQDLTFDDGVLHLVSVVPDAFYRWITSREVVINDTTQIIGYTLCTWKFIDNVEEKWQVPGNNYIKFVPSKANANLTFTLDASEAVPGIPYMLEIVFAPDTSEENTKPTKLQIKGNYNDGTTGTLGESNYEIPATQVTRLALADPVTNLVSLKIQMNILVRQNSIYQRVIRLAEVRLKPQGK